jgi:hypothetical protein
LRNLLRQHRNQGNNVNDWLEISVYDGNGDLLYSDMGKSREALKRAAREELGPLDGYTVLIT